MYDVARHTRGSGGYILQPRVVWVIPSLCTLFVHCRSIATPPPPPPPFLFLFLLLLFFQALTPRWGFGHVHIFLSAVPPDDVPPDDDWAIAASPGDGVC